MKLRAWFLILCIGMMCLTGFGQTTSDLTTNSKTEQVVDSSQEFTAAVNVVEQTNRFDQKFAEADRAFKQTIDWQKFQKDLKAARMEAVAETNLELATHFKKSRDEMDKLAAKLLDPEGLERYRKARDGLNYRKE